MPTASKSLPQMTHLRETRDLCECYYPLSCKSLANAFFTDDAIRENVFPILGRLDRKFEDFSTSLVESAVDKLDTGILLWMPKGEIVKVLQAICQNAVKYKESRANVLTNPDRTAVRSKSKCQIQKVLIHYN